MCGLAFGIKMRRAFLGVFRGEEEVVVIVTCFWSLLGLRSNMPDVLGLMPFRVEKRSGLYNECGRGFLISSRGKDFRSFLSSGLPEVIAVSVGCSGELFVIDNG